VMGSKGLKGMTRLLMGSVSRNVSEKAKCSVMIVR
jgi:nucleotide-binding universal stress UspA family protein